MDGQAVIDESAVASSTLHRFSARQEIRRKKARHASEHERLDVLNSRGPGSAGNSTSIAIGWC